MTQAQIMDLIRSLLFTEVEATGDGDEAIGQTEGLPKELMATEHAALPGFSSGISTGDRMLVVRRGNIAISIAALNHPAGEAAGDRTIWTSAGLTALWRDKVFEITGSEATAGIKLDGTTKVVRDLDKTHADVNMAIWIAAVTAGLNAVLGPGTIVAPTDFGVCDASTTKVLAG